MPKSMNIGMMMAVAAWPAAMALVAVVCGCGRESEQAEKPAPDVQVAQPPVVQPPAAQPPVEQQPSVQGQGGTAINPATALDPDAIAITNISAMTEMEYASLDGGPAPLRMYEPREPSGEAAKWFECADMSARNVESAIPVMARSWMVRTIGLFTMRGRSVMICTCCSWRTIRAR